MIVILIAYVKDRLTNVEMVIKKDDVTKEEFTEYLERVGYIITNINSSEEDSIFNEKYIKTSEKLLINNKHSKE